MTQLRQESMLGFFAMFSWCVISSVAYVFTTLLEEKLEPTLLCFSIFFVATVFFILSRFNSLHSLLLKCKAQPLNSLMINVTTFGCWFLTIYPLRFIDPSIAQSIVLATLPIATLLIGIMLYKGQNVGYLDYVISIFLFIGIFFIALICLDQKIAIQKFTVPNLVIVFLCCTGAGAFLAINNIYAKKLSNGGFSPFDILAIRFILLILTTGLLSYYKLNQLYRTDIITNVLISAFSLIIIPQIVFQYSLKELEPITISIISPLMPVLIFVVEIFSNKLNPNFLTIIVITYICLASILGVKIRYNHQKKHCISKASMAPVRNTN